jgi:hypothetical protein
MEKFESMGTSGYIYTGGSYTGSSGTSGTAGLFGTSGYSGSSGWAGSPPEDKIITITITNRDRMRRIKVKKEKKIEPERTEVKPSPVFEMALKMVKSSFYGIFGIKVKETKTPEVSGRVKKIKWKQN